MGRRRIPIAPGDRFGHLVVVREIQPRVINDRLRRVFVFKCDCGSETEKSIQAVRYVRTRTCSYTCPYRFENTTWYKKRMANK
jgi:hypothetical protein